ncbi:hypothetical protein [Nitrosomonas marina]|uniref:hypothetical protein n=1 Tax=Nitrosomonas marina TaxID=917 RepID=UPI00115F7EF4|nr:hypothetical protein [Nitrosomonas marina]
MIAAEMNVARLNLSLGNIEEHQTRLNGFSIRPTRWVCGAKFTLYTGGRIDTVAGVSVTYKQSRTGNSGTH